MRAFFIFNNIKVNPFLPGDAPFPGFELVLWEHESWLPSGTLWDVGGDAGFTQIGNKRIKGQIWVAEDLSQIYELENILGLNTGRVERTKVRVVVKPHAEIVHEVIDATAYKLTKIDKCYKIVNDENWDIKRK